MAPKAEKTTATPALPGLDDLVGYHLRRASIVDLQGASAALEGVGSRPVPFSVLLCIIEKPGISAAEICRALGMQRANIVPILAELEGRGLFLREADSRDNRIQRLFPTRHGQDVAAQGIERVAQHEEILLQHLSVEERHELRRFLAKIWQEKKTATKADPGVLPSPGVWEETMTRVDTTPATSGRVLLLVFLAAVIEGFDLQSAGVAAPKLVPVFSLTPNQIGLFFSAATVGLIVGALAGGRIADAWGRRAGLVLSLVTFGIFSLATALAASFDQLLIMRFLTGVGLGGALPNLVNIADEAAGPARRARAVALMYAGVPLGGALAGLTVLSGLQGNSWSFIFMVGGVLPLLLAPVVYLGLPALRGTTAVRRGMGDSLKDIVAPPVLFASLALWVSFFLGLLVVYLLLNWLPQLLVAHGLTRADASWVQVVFNIGGVIGSLVGGRLLDRRHPLIPVGLGFAATAIALLMIAFLPPSLGWMLLGGGLVGGTILCVQAVLYGMAPQCYPFSSRGTGVGVAVAMGRLGSIAGPLLAGVLVAGGSSPADVMVALVPIILCAGGTTLMLIARHRREVVPA